MALIATTPPLRRLARALITTFPLGVNVIARSSFTGGVSSSPPTQVAPSEAAVPGDELFPDRRQIAFHDVPVGAADTASKHPQQKMPPTCKMPPGERTAALISSGYRSHCGAGWHPARRLATCPTTYAMAR